MHSFNAQPVVLQRSAAILAMAFVAVLGMTSLVSADSIMTTGANSSNNISRSISENCTIKNTNNIKAYNDNSQEALSGEAEARSNTTAGSTTSGEAVNENSTTTRADVSNGHAGASCTCPGGEFGGAHTDPSQAVINTTGANSDNTISYDTDVNTTVNNHNNVYVSNDNDQLASSGDATSTGNTTAGNTTSGDAVNDNATQFLASIRNDAPVGAAMSNGHNCGASSGLPVGGVGGGSGNVNPNSTVFPQTTSRSPERANGIGGGNGGSHSARTFYNSRNHQPVAVSVMTSGRVTSSVPASQPTRVTTAPVGGGSSAVAPVSMVTPRAPVAPTATISNTGFNSDNSISSNYSSNTSVTNTNNVSVHNTSNQTALSGDASSTQNTTAGSTTSGEAYNGNDTVTAVTLKN